MRIRLAKLKELDSIIGFDHVAPTQKSRRVFIERSILKNRCYVAITKEELVGYIILEYSFFECGFVSMLYVKEKYRRKGIGTKLMEYIETKCTTEKLFTSTNQSNIPMQGLLKTLNFARSGIVHNLDPGDPELIYFKRISRS
ncbi:MAG: GNAT family N-acetyltransferase [Candidatus Heimdallarchaeota archaeon]